MNATDDLSYEGMVAAARAVEERLVVVEHRHDRAVVRLDDPSTLNSLSAPLTVQLLDELGELTRDPAIRSIVLTGTDPAFSAGGNLRLMLESAHPLVDRSDEGATAVWRWIRHQFGGVVRLIARSDTTFIAAVNGAAAGVGLAFALACDVIVASERARIVPAFLPIGLVPEVGTSWLLTRRLGYQGTFAMFAGGQELSGERAAELGLVNELVPHDELLEAADRWSDRIAALPAHAVAMTKPLLRAAADMTWDQAIAMEEYAEPMCFTTRAHRDAVEALVAPISS